MKSSNGFDARRLRPREPKNWRLRLGLFIGALLLIFGLLLALIGGLSLLGLADQLGDLEAGRDGGIVMLVVGLVVAWIGQAIWRRCRRSQRRPSELSLSPRLMKKRN